MNSRIVHASYWFWNVMEIGNAIFRAWKVLERKVLDFCLEKFYNI